MLSIAGLIDHTTMDVLVATANTCEGSLIEQSLAGCLRIDVAQGLLVVAIWYHLCQFLLDVASAHSRISLVVLGTLQA